MLAAPLCCGEISTELPSCWGPLSCNRIVSLRVQILLPMCFRLCKNKCIGWIQPYYTCSGFWLHTILSFIYYNSCATPCFYCTQSRDSDLLRAGRSGDRIPVGARFSTPVQVGPGPPPQPPV